MAENKFEFNSFEKGLYTDSCPELQPDGTYTYALNAVNETQTSNNFGLANEESNILCAKLDNKIYHVQEIPAQNSKIIFHEGGVSKLNYECGCTYENIIECDSLTYEDCSFMKSTFRVGACGNTFVYFTTTTGVKRLNLDDPSCEDLDLNYCACPPSISTQLGANGSLESGSYQFAIQYCKDDDYSNFYNITNPTYVHNSSLNSDLSSIQGSEPFTLTNKSINIDLTDLDPNYSCFRLVAIQVSGGITTAKVFNEVEYNGTTHTVNFNSYDGQDISLEEILTKTLSFQKVQGLMSYNQQLVMWGAETYQEENFQQFANQITTSYSVKKIPTTDAARDPKLAVSFMRDEVYSFGIRWIYCDGTKSRVFHIPGPTNINQSTCPDVECVDINLLDNTAAKTQASLYDAEVNESTDPCNLENTYPIVSRGTLGHYYSCETYPSTEDCNGNLIWGDLAGTPIRHHKMPCNSLEPHFLANTTDVVNCENTIPEWTDSYIFPLQVEFDNITLPQSNKEIKSYEIVQQKREGRDKSILAKGLLINNFQVDLQGTTYATPNIGINSNYYYASDSINTGITEFASQSNNNIPLTDSFSFYSPTTQFNQPLLNPNVIKFNSKLCGTGLRYGVVAKQGEFGDQIGTRQNILLGQVCENLEGCRHTKVRALSYAQNNSIVSNIPNAEHNYYNIYGDSSVYLELDQTTVTQSDESYADFTEDGPCNSTPLDGSAFYVTLKNSKCDLYGNVSGALYYPISSTNIAQGDSFITYHSWVKTDLTLAFPAGQVPVKTLIQYWVESDINTFMRYKCDSQIESAYYPNLGGFTLDSEVPQDATWPDSYLNNFLYIDEDNEDALVYNPQTYCIDDTFNKFNCIEGGIGISTSFDPCCVQEGTDIYVSDTQGTNSKIDNYTKFRTNNTVTIPRHLGDVTNVFTIGNDIYAQTCDGLFLISRGQRTLQTNEGENIYLGNGSIFNFEPQQVHNTLEGFAGNCTPNSTLYNQFGAFWMDEKAGKVYHMSEGVQEISMYGMRNFFKENSKICMKESICSYECAGPCGLGFRLGFDHRHNRLLITKKDYSPLAKLTEFKRATELDYSTLELNQILYNSLSNKWFTYRGSSILEEIEIGDPLYFCDKSWTLSYSPQEKKWISFHSYIPDLYSNDRDHMYTIKDNGVWKHDDTEESFQSFYGEYYPHIIEYVTKSENIFSSEEVKSMKLYTEALKFFPEHCTYVPSDITFNEAIFYNSRQNTGEVTLEDINFKDKINLLDNITDVPKTIKLEKPSKAWNINDISDKIKDVTEPIWTCSCKPSQFKEILENNIDYSKQYKSSIFDDNYLYNRLIFSNFAQSNYRLYTKAALLYTNKKER